jgi:anaerobic selenocysteine-containing dehydrogenase
MLTGNATQLASTYYQVKVGGDVAVLKGMMKYAGRAMPADRRRTRARR